MTRPRWAAIGVVVAASLVVEHFAHPEHETWWTGIPGFFVLYGFVGCVAIVVLSKWYGKLWVQRGEDYYADSADPDPHRARTGAEDPGAGSVPTRDDRLLAGDPPAEDGEAP